MKQQFEGKMHIVEIAEQAMKDANIEPKIKAIRGGTVHNCLIWDCLVLIFLQEEKISIFYEYVALESMGCESNLNIGKSEEISFFNKIITSLSFRRI